MSESAPGPQKLSPTHRAIAQWLLENPGAKRHAVCAEYFNVSRSWLSTVIHSDAFQAHLQELELKADQAVVHDIPAKLRGVASLAIDGLAEAVEAAMDSGLTLLHRDFLADTADMTLQKLGYGQPKPAPAPFGAQQNNFYIGQVAPGVLAGARARLLTLQPNMEVNPGFSEARQLPTSIEGSDGEVQR